MRKMKNIGTKLLIALIAMVCVLQVATVASAAAPSVSADRVDVSMGDIFEIDVTVDPHGNSVYGAQYDLTFNPAILQFVKQTKGDFLSQAIEYGETRMGAEDGVTGAGVLATITFEAVSAGSTDLEFSDVIVSDTAAKPIGGVVLNNGKVNVTGEPQEEPDLTITEKSETLTGSTLEVTYTVTNNGGGDAGASTTEIHAGDQIATDSVGALTAGASHTSTVTIDPFNCPCGTAVTVKVCTDNENVVDESDETNNCLENTFDCPPCPKPDLEITAKSETFDGSTLNVTYTVTNTGGVAAGASTTCIYVDDTEVATDPVGALAAGATHEGTVVIDPFDCPCGTTIMIKVCADNEDVVDESNETNNCIENAFNCPSCPGGPDLVITGKSETLVGSAFTVTYTVKNNGGGDADASTTGIYADGAQIATDSVGALAAGATHEGTVVIDPFDCPCGTAVTVKVCADNENVVDESDETNNCLENAFNCPLCAVDPLLCPIPNHNFGVVQPGQTETRQFDVTNCGGAGTLTWTVSDDHSWITVSPTSGTDAGTVTVTINTAGLSDGTHTGTVTVASDYGTKTGMISVNVQTSSLPPSPPAEVPTFTPIGMLAMVGLLGIAGIGVIKRR
jgi:hypothetical protein